MRTQFNHDHEKKGQINKTGKYVICKENQKSNTGHEKEVEKFNYYLLM